MNNIGLEKILSRVVEDTSLRLASSCAQIANKEGEMIALNLIKDEIAELTRAVAIVGLVLANR